MRKLPFMGEPREEWETLLCGFAGVVPHSDDLTCCRDAIWHGFVLDDPCEQIVAMMSCCDEHLPYMKLTADFVHRVKHPCGVPGSSFRWPENECYTDWDEADEFAAEAELVTA